MGKWCLSMACAFDCIGENLSLSMGGLSDLSGGKLVLSMTSLDCDCREESAAASPREA